MVLRYYREFIHVQVRKKNMPGEYRQLGGVSNWIESFINY